MTETPAGWTATTLGQIGRYLNGRAFQKSEWTTDGRPIIRIQNLTGSGAAHHYFQGAVEDRYVARPGDLLVSWAATLGAYIWPGPEAVVNQHIFKVESTIETKFHKYLLDHKLSELMRHTHGSGMVHITRPKFDSLPVDIPPMEEQLRIVEILEDHLSRLDAGNLGLAATKSRLTALERSALNMHFGPDGHDVPLSELVADISAGRSFGSSNSPASDAEWGIIKVSAMTWGAFRAGENKAVADSRVDPRFEIHEGDLLVSRANTSDYVGASVLVGPVRPKLLLSDKSLRLTPREGVRTAWLWRALQAPSTRRQITTLATGTKDSMRNISQTSLLRVRLSRQGTHQQEAALEAFAHVTSAVEQTQSELERQGRRSESLRRSLLAAAFSGQLTGKRSDLDRAQEMAGR